MYMTYVKNNCATHKKERRAWYGFPNNKLMQLAIRTPMIDDLDLDFLTTEISTASLMPLTSNIVNILCVDEGEISGQGVQGNHREDRNGESNDKGSHGTGARIPAPGSEARSSKGGRSKGTHL